MARIAYPDALDGDAVQSDSPDYDQCPGCEHWWPLADMSVNRSGDNICPDCVFSWSAYPDHR